MTYLNVSEMDNCCVSNELLEDGENITESSVSLENEFVSLKRMYESHLEALTKQISMLVFKNHK